MGTFLISFAIVLAVGLFVWSRLARSNMDVPPNVERKLPEREALHFALDNDLPINPR